MASRRNERRKQAQIENSKAYKFYFNKLKSLALIRLEWKNMPDEINIEYLNETILTHNLVFFKETDLDQYVALNATLTGVLDVYGEPVERIAHGVNGYTNTLNKNNSVLIKNTPLKYGDMSMTTIEGIEYYASQLADIDRTIAVNIKRQKLPWTIAADKKSEITIDEFFDQVDENIPMVHVDKDFGKFVEVLNLQAPFVAPQLYQLKQSIWMEALTFLGIPNSSIEKRERVNVSEVETNNAGTIMQRYVILDPLVRACEKINKMFNLNVSVEFRNNLTAELDGTNEQESGDYNEQSNNDN